MLPVVLVEVVLADHSSLTHYAGVSHIEAILSHSHARTINTHTNSRFHVFVRSKQNSHSA